MPKPCFLVRIFSVGMVVMGAGLACGQNYPNKPIRIVTSEPGGGSDFTARMLAQGLTVRLGQQVIVDNRAGTITAAQIMTKAAADGYTLLSYNNSLWTLPLLQKMFYDPVRDFSPIIMACMRRPTLTRCSSTG